MRFTINYGSLHIRPLPQSICRSLIFTISIYICCVSRHFSLLAGGLKTQSNWRYGLLILRFNYKWGLRAKPFIFAIFLSEMVHHQRFSTGRWMTFNAIEFIFVTKKLEIPFISQCLNIMNEFPLTKRENRSDFNQDVDVIVFIVPNCLDLWSI